MADSTTLPRLTRDERQQRAPQTDEQLLEQARRRFQEAQDAENEERAQQYQALKFRSGQHWSEGQIAQRTQEGQELPCLVINRTESYINQVLNSYRKNPLGMRVRAKSGGASKEVADVLEGALRETEQQSHADVAYTTAFSQALGQGEGYFRLSTEYEAWDSFQQCIRIQPIYSRFSVYADPSGVDPAGLDMQWCFVVTRLSHDAFCSQYGVAPADVGIWAGYGDTDWVSRDEVAVADYYYKTWETLTIVQFPDGTVLEQTPALGDLDPTWPTRTTQRVTVHWVQLCGYAVLKKTRWYGQYIPVIRVEGQRLDIDNHARRTGMVQASADSAFAYDVYASQEMAAILLAPKAPYILYAEQIAGYEPYWNAANDGHLPYLPVKAETVGGQLLPLPQRQVAEPAIQAITAARMGAAADLQASLGMFDPTKLNPGAEQSGVALENRQVQGEQSNYSYAANLAWSIRACGIQILDLLPKLYSGPTDIRQIGPDGTVRMQKVNQPYTDGQGRPQPALMLGKGTYDVVISAGPSYETSRRETSDKLGTMLAAVQPEVQAYFLDIWAGSLDFPGSQDLADRFRTLVPPEALQASEGHKPEQQVAMLQNQVQQAGQQLQVLQQQLQEAKQTEQVATHSLALTEQENARLKTQLADKTRDLQVEMQKATWSHEEQLQENALKAEELRLKYGQALAQQAMDQERLRMDQAQSLMPATNGQEA